MIEGDLSAEREAENLAQFEKQKAAGAARSELSAKRAAAGKKGGRRNAVDPDKAAERDCEAKANADAEAKANAEADAANVHALVQLAEKWGIHEDDIPEDASAMAEAAAAGLDTSKPALRRAYAAGRDFRRAVLAKANGEQNPPLGANVGDGRAAVAAKPKAKRASSGGRGPNKLSMLDAAAQVLAGATQPMGCKEMVAEMASRGLWETANGQTPHATLYASILVNLRKQDSRFVKTGPGKFALAGK